MRGRRVVVVGDAMLDRYVMGDTERISPEAPVPVVTVHERRSALGGAANVAANVAAIGAGCVLVGVVGTDPDGTTLRQDLVTAGISDRYLLSLPGRPTTCKTRVVVRGQQVVRIDEEVDALLEPADLERLTGLLLEALASADALLFEDYNKGVLAPALIRAGIAAARERGIPIVVDPKFRRFFEYAGATIFKPNRRELEAALGAAVDLAHPDALHQARQRLEVENLLLTVSAEGMLLVGAGSRLTRIPSLAREVFDVSGAGDTVTAWVGTALAAGATPLEAAQLATYAAGVEVSKAGVATVSLEEVLSLASASEGR
jgi:D-beta-D-heptose 7-phosphate kinase/D-beta-D-heptose 1-phosphate adenosyltransferase